VSKKNKILITGGAGFIGFHLALKLSEDAANKVIVIDNLQPSYGTNLANIRKDVLLQHNILFIQEDISKDDFMSHDELSDIDYLIHLAAWPGVRKGQELPVEYYKNNITAFGNVLQLSRTANLKRFLFASSSSVYGDLGNSGPVDESSANGMNLKSFYSATKWMNEIAAKSFCEISNVPTIALRFFTVYGEFGRPDMAYWKFSRNILKGEVIQLYGENGGVRNFTAIDSAIHAINQLIKCNIDFSLTKYLPINIADPETFPTRLMLDILKKNLDSQHELSISCLDRPKEDVETTWASVRRLESIIGELPKTDFEKNIANFASWIKHYLTSKENI
jgi:UDP-glucuronate 4-epimerase